MERLPAHAIQPSTTDGQVLTTVDGLTAWANPGGGGGPLPPGVTVLVPLTTTVDGVPQLIWDDNDMLVMTEVDA